LLKKRFAWVRRRWGAKRPVLSMKLWEVRRELADALGVKVSELRNVE